MMASNTTVMHHQQDHEDDRDVAQPLERRFIAISKLVEPEDDQRERR